MFSLLNDRFFDASFNRMNRAFQTPERENETWGTLKDDKDHYTLLVPLPGLTEKDVEISATERGISLKANKRDIAQEGWKPVWSERQAFALNRSLALPSRIDADKVQASLKNGLLTVTLPKQGSGAARNIPVQA